MTISILSELQTEVNRLFLAGSGMAKGDPRIKRLAPALLKIGDGVPVFARLAEYAEGLAEAGPEESPQKLLELGELLYSVLYTQGDTSPEGDYRPIPDSGADRDYSETRTEQKYSKLSVLIDALENRRSGRLEIISRAYYEGVFSDIRTHGPAVRALDDRNPDVAEFMEKRVIPAIGSGAVVHLLMTFDPGGDRGNARRLRLLADMGYGGAEALAVEAAERHGTSVPVALAAIGIIAQNASNEELLLALSKNKNKIIQEAALIELSKLNSQEGKRLILEAFSGKNYALAINPLAFCRDPFVKLEALSILRGMERSLLSDAIQDRDKGWERIIECAGALRGTPHTEIINYFRDTMFAAARDFSFSEQNTMRPRLFAVFLDCLVSFGTEEADCALEALAADSEVLKAYRYVVSCWFHAAARTFSKERMFEEFVSWYRNGFIDHSDFEWEYEELSALDVRWMEEFLFPVAGGPRDFDRRLGVKMSDPHNIKHMETLVKLLKDGAREAERLGSRFAPGYLPVLLDRLREADLLREAEAVLGEHRPGSGNSYLSAIGQYLIKLNEEDMNEQ